MARLCATPGSFPHVDAASSRVRSSSSPWWSAEAGSSWGRPPLRTVAGWTQAQGDASHSGSLADAAQPPYRESWHLDVPLGGPDGDFGLSQPVSDGSVAIAVGADADRRRGPRERGATSGPSIGTTDHPCRRPSPQTPRRRILIYTEGFGDSPPGVERDSARRARARRESVAAARHPGPVRSIRMSRRSTSDTRKPVWDAPVPLRRGQSNRRHGRRGHRVPRRQRRSRLRRCRRHRRDPVDGGCRRVPDDASGGLERPRDRGRSRRPLVASEARRVPRVRRFARLERRHPGRGDLRVVTRDRRRSGRGGVLGQDRAGVRAVRRGGSVVGPAQQRDVLHGRRGADLGRDRGRRRGRAGLPVGPRHR